MERLTIRDAHGRACIEKQREDDESYVFIQNNYYVRGDAADRLAAYEDTGLTPEEIKEDTPNIRLIEEKLAAYEDAEENGRLIVLPKNYDEIYDKRGDTICGVIDGEITELIMTDIFIGREHKLMIDCFEMERKWLVEGGEVVEREEPKAYAFSISDIGKTIFLTREEAEAALAAMEGREDG